MNFRRTPATLGLCLASFSSAIAAYATTPAPTFSVPAGNYQRAQTVAIHDAASGAAIYYTTNGLAPTTSSARYAQPVAVNNTMRLRAIAVAQGSISATTTVSYNITPAQPATFSVPAGTYQTTQTVSIHDATAGAVLYFTTSGWAPTTASTRYTGPITVNRSLPLRAIAVFPGGPASSVATAVYTIAPAATPTFSLPAGTYTGNQNITISDATRGASIYYTTNGLAPTASSARYTGPVTIASTQLLRAIAVFPNGPVSTVASSLFTITPATKPIKAPNTSATFFGMTVNHLLSGTPWPQLQFGTLRLWDTGTLWGNLNPTEGTFNWGNLDKQMNLARANDAQTIYTFGGVPPWAIPTNITIQSVKRSQGVVTVTTAVPHGLYFNALQPSTSQTKIVINGITDGSFDGSFYLSSTPNNTTFTYSQGGANTASSSGTVSATCGGVYAPAACAEAPADLGKWDQYLSQLVAHLGPGAIQYWELWNEANIPDYWRGNPETLVTMAEHARRIIKSVDPKAVILSPSVTGNYETQTECDSYTRYCGSAWLGTWLGLGGRGLVDGVAFHGYPAIGEAPEQIQGAVGVLAAVMNKNGMGTLPLWDTESSWGRAVQFPTEENQMAWVAKHLILEQSIGVQRSFWYAYDNATWGSLWTGASGVNQAGSAFEQVHTWLTGAAVNQPCTALANDPTTYVCGYTRANGYVAQAVWTTGAAKDFRVSSNLVQYRDLNGAVHSVNADAVEISSTPILLENSSAF